MPKFPMTRCRACNATIKRDHEYHAEIIRTNITGWLDDLTSSHHNGFYCCDCLGHKIGWCIEEIRQERFGKALIRGIAQQTGYVRSGTHASYLG